MAVNFASAFYNFLTADATLMALLANGTASVFTNDQPKKGTPLPYIVTPGAVTDGPNYSHKQSFGREHERDIRCYVSRKEHRSTSLADDIAERVYELVQDSVGTMIVPGLSVEDFEVTLGPIPLDDSEALGRVITTRLVVS